MSQDRIETAKKYANAILAVLKESNDVDSERPEILSLGQIFSDNPQLGTVLDDNSVKLEVKSALLAPIMEQASDFTKRLLEVIKQNRRFPDLALIVAEFEKAAEADAHVVRAEVTSATELDADQKAKIEAAFAKRVGAKKVILSTNVDSSIIGGIVLRSNDTIIDGSVKAKINKVKKLLLN